MTLPHRILICDDDDAVRSSLGFLLKNSGYTPNFASSPGDILKHVNEIAFDLVLLDMNYSQSNNGEEGIDLLQNIKKIRPSTPVVLMTAWASVELAVRGIKLGASDFITKPWNNNQLLKIIETSITLSSVAVKEIPISEKLENRSEFGDIIGNDPKLIKILEVIRRVARTHAPVLITGESGTGKELIASAIHQHSSRSLQNFIKVNLGGIPPGLFESEMFGYRKGAFTDAKSDRAGRFEKANKGTIFLDEIGDLNFTSQVKLLRVLQDQTFERLGDPNSITVDVRIISATNHNLYSLVKKGSFREDLLYRINLIQIEVPSLRQRNGDIHLLAEHFISQAAKTYSVPSKMLTPGAVDWLCGQPWPGNVRELKNVMERTLLMTSGDNIRADDFIAAGKPGEIEFSGNSRTLDEMEKQMIISAIEECGGNLSKAAGKLGISRPTLYRKIERHGIQIENNE
jgi:two-component system, NtrC family, response regulator